MPIFQEAGNGIRGSSTVTAELTVEKDVAVQVHGFLDAKQRLAEAIATTTDPDESANDVYCCLVEAFSRSARSCWAMSMPAPSSLRGIVTTTMRRQRPSS